MSTTVFATILLITAQVESFGLNETISNKVDRSFDLSEYGIDLGATFDRLLSPKGIVNQFSLTFAIQMIVIVGYIITGKMKILKDQTLICKIIRCHILHGQK